MDVDALTDDLARAMGAARASTAGGNDGTSRAARCVRGVAGCLTRKMSVGEAVRAVRGAGGEGVGAPSAARRRTTRR